LLLVRPVLYPNGHLNAVGQEQAQRDIAACVALAGAHVKNNPSTGAAGDAVKAGAIGARTPVRLPAQSGATAGTMCCIFCAKDPSPVYKSFVNRCLRGKSMSFSAGSVCAENSAVR